VDLPAAAAAWQRALTGARAVGNTVLEPLVLMNLGVVSARLGDRTQQLEYQQQSARLFEAQGQQQRAAELDANVGAVFIAYAGRSEEGVRRVQNALSVSQKLGNTNFELFAARLIASSDRYAGRYDDAERGLNRALNLAKERDLDDYIRTISLELARLRVDQGRYADAIQLLSGTIGDTTQASATPSLILRGEAATRLRDFAAAQRDLDQADRNLQAGADPEFLPLLYAAQGRLAYESGRLRDARASFSRASAFWKDDLPEADSVEARAMLGFLDVMDGRTEAGRAEISQSLAQAQRMGRQALEARCRELLARANGGKR
jgi:predicted negative regulator of RcsB-dependent stress response